VRPLPASIYLAQEMGTGLGPGQILLGTVPPQRQTLIARHFAAPHNLSGLPRLFLQKCTGNVHEHRSPEKSTSRRSHKENYHHAREVTFQ
jgi:hypothetical protein